MERRQTAPAAPSHASLRWRTFPVDVGEAVVAVVWEVGIGLRARPARLVHRQALEDAAEVKHLKRRPRARGLRVDRLQSLHTREYPCPAREVTGPPRNPVIVEVSREA